MLEFLVPGSIGTATGGYAYDRHMIAGLRELGWAVNLRELHAGFPLPDGAALEHAAALLAALPQGAQVLIDGLALGALPAQVAEQSSRLHLVALIHHPLHRETGLAPALARQLADGERRALQAVERIIVTSAATAALLAQDGVPAARIAVVEPGVAAPSRSMARDSPAAAPRLLCVATVTPRKGHALLIDALQSLAHLPWSLECVGSLRRDADCARQLREQIEAAELGARVALRGEVDGAALEAAHARADLFVLATYFEGYGMAVAEAAACGLPVLATRTGAHAQLLQSGAGVLVEPGDRAALRAALHELLQPGPLAQLAQRARSAAERRQRRGWDQAARELAAALN